MVHYDWKDGRVVYCGCLENSWVNSPGGSNPSPSAHRQDTIGYFLLWLTSHGSICYDAGDVLYLDEWIS